MTIDNALVHPQKSSHPGKPDKDHEPVSFAVLYARKLLVFLPVVLGFCPMSS